MALALADLLRRHWPEFRRQYRKHLCAAHHRAVRSVLACRTPALGGRLYRCGGCGKSHFAYHSCNHRSCPGCGARGQQEWTARQEARLLPGVPYFMVTFTVPDQLRALCRARPRELYDLLLRESAAALQDVAATKLGGARLGFTSVLHTWGRQMGHHPHVHCIVPAVALDPSKRKLVQPADDAFLVHFRPLAQRFRNRVRGAIREHHPDIHQTLSTDQRRALSGATTWNVQLQSAGDGKTAVRYLARYVGRSAFSAKRLLGYDPDGKVRLAWTSSQTGERGVLHLRPHEFIRRWLTHVLPKGFARIRHYGFHSGAAKKSRTLVRVLLGASLNEPPPRFPEPEPFTCQHCGGALHYQRDIARIHPARGPPPRTHLQHGRPAAAETPGDKHS